MTHRLLRVDRLGPLDSPEIRKAYCSCGATATCDDYDAVRLYMRLHREHPDIPPGHLARLWMEAFD